MARCLFSPDKGKVLFDGLRDMYGYEVAKRCYLLAINNKFTNKYKDKIKFDSENIPTIESLMTIPYFTEAIGEDKIIESKKKSFKKLEDNLSNYKTAVEEANKFNTDHKNARYVAIVNEQDGMLITDVMERDEENTKKAEDQYNTLQMNKAIANELSSVGVSIGILSEKEKSAGRLGVTDFMYADNVATGSVEMIRIANGKKGSEALTEEFCHVVIGANKDKDLIKRSISLLKKDEALLKSILGNEYDSVVSFYSDNMDLVAEEALGQVLRDVTLNKADQSVSNQSLFTRLVTFIKNIFSRFNADSVENRYKKVKNNMSFVSNNMFKGEYRLSRNRLSKSRRNVLFNSLDDSINRNIDVLKKAMAAEAKRHHVIFYANKKDQSKIINTLLEKTENIDFEETVEGIFEYINFAKKELKDCFKNLDIVESGKSGNKEYNINERAEILRTIRSYIDSFKPFIDNMNNVFNEERTDTGLSDLEKTAEKLFAVKNEDGTEENKRIKDIFDSLIILQNDLESRYKDQLKIIVKEFLSQYFDKDIKVSFDGKETKTLDDILNYGKLDISFTDMWLDSMGTTSSEIHQLLNNIVMQHKDMARKRAIELNESVLALRKKAVSLGITDYSWMFEKYRDGSNTGRLITKVNKSQFYKDRAEMYERLDKKYGKQAIGEDATNKINEELDWLNEHCSDTFRQIPNSSYNNKEYERLTQNQKEILEEYIKLKAEADKLYGNESYCTVAVQLRKTGLQRIVDSTNASKAWENAKNAFLEDFVVNEDDGDLYGDDSVKGIVDYNGREIMKLPKLLRTRLKDPNELSDDVFGALLQYNFCASEFDSLNGIVHAMENVRSYMKETSKVYAASGLKEKAEKYFLGKDIIENKVEKENSYFFKKLDEFYASQLYMKHKSDPTILGDKVSATKLSSTVMKYAALAQLGGNFLANFANVTTGVAMMNIEAFSGQYVKASELFDADKKYISMVPGHIKDILSVEKTNDIDLISDYFGYRQDMYKTIKNNANSGLRGLMSRFFGNITAFIGQEAGDHWLYNRMAIGMMIHKKIFIIDENGNKKESSVFDAISFDEKADIRKIKFPEHMLDSDGKEFDPMRFGRQIAHVCGGLFGEGYSQDDENIANRYVFGMNLMYLHKWIKPQYNKRFMNAQYSDIMGEVEEGYWRTGFTFCAVMANELRRGQFQLVANWNKLSNQQRHNIWRCVTEMLQVGALYALQALIFGDDPDKNRPKNSTMSALYDFLQYNLLRSEHEIGGLVPSTTMVKEFIKTIESPLPVLSEINKLINLIELLFPWNYHLFSDEIDRGKWKGYTKAEKIFWKAPIPYSRQIQEWMDTLDGLQEEMLFYRKN